MTELLFRWRRAVPVASLAVLTTVGLVGAASASADPSAPAKGAPSPAPATDLDAGCTLRPSLTSGSERSSCLGVGATLSSVPALGGTATLTVTVRAGRVEKATAVTVDLPPVLAFADGTASSAAVTGAGPSSRATLATVDLAAGQTRTFTRTVKAVAAGAGEIAATATSVVRPGRTDSGADHVHLTVGATAATSRPGIPANALDHAVARGTAPAAAPAVSRPSVRVAGAGKATAASTPAKAPGTACATGTWTFVDQNGTSRGVGKVFVQALATNGTLLNQVQADGVGGYTVCWATGGATTSVAIRFILTNRVWKIVTNTNSEFFWTTGTITVADNTTFGLGVLRPADPLDYRANHLYLDASYMIDWMYQNSPGRDPNVGCWSPYGSSCFQLVVHWQRDSTSGPVFSGAQVFVPAASPDSEDEPVHEYGHALMYGLYGNTFPATTNCSPHSLFLASSDTCAWTEGFADWVPVSVWQNTLYTFPGGGSTQFDTTWNDGGATGDTVEGRVVQALASLNDGVKYPFDNISGPGINAAANYFTVLRSSRPNTMGSFWSGRAAAGQDVSQASLSALYQGTIDYGFRNPLTDGASKNMPQASPPHNYSATTTRGYWSVVAARPADTNDADVYVYDDSAQGTLLGSSAFGGSTTDFVAINSNSGARALQTYYPRVRQFSGTGNYTVEFVQGSSTLSTGATTLTTSSSLPVNILDSYQSAGVPVYYRAVPQNGQSLTMTFMQPGGSVQSRSSGVSSPTGAAGDEIAFSTTPTATGYGSVVVTNQGMTSGTVALYADTSAPTGTVSIKNGAATAPSTTVPLTLSATDDQTGVDQMQISTDGTFDNEQVVPYSTTATAKLAGANGTKTVYVRFRNQAGMWSSPVSDTIKLAAPPKLTSASPAAGPVAGGNAITLTGQRFTGATKVTFGGVTGTNLIVVSDTKITVQVPAGAAGAVTVKVTNTHGASTDAVKYTYKAAPVVTSLSKTSGPKAGGVTIKVNGTGFTGATKVAFGGTAGTHLTVVSSTQISIVTPAHAAGKVDVTVTGPGGTSAVGAGDKYTFQ